MLTNLSAVRLTEGQINKLEATLQESLQSPTIDFAVLNLAQRIYNRTPLPFGDSDQANENDAGFQWRAAFPAQRDSCRQYGRYPEYL